jgi:hypothetical protein
MHARRPIRPHMAIKPKIEVSAGGKAFIRLSLKYLVESYTVLAYQLTKRCYVPAENEPFVPARHESVHIHYRSL